MYDENPTVALEPIESRNLNLGQLHELVLAKCPNPGPSKHPENSVSLPQSVGGAVGARNKELAPPANHALRSQGEGLVIIVKPVGEQAGTFLKNPIILAKAIKNSIFARNECNDMRVNNRRNILCIQLKKQDKDLIPELLTVRNIGEWPVQCYQPTNDISCYGVIGPIHPDMDLNDIKENMHTGGEKIEIVNLVRMDQFQTGNRKPSSSIKVQFKSKVIPKNVYLDMISYPVREFCLPPLRCFRCQTWTPS